jgi:GT2 family glycosyltransferase
MKTAPLSETLAIIIASKNRPDNIRLALASIALQTRQPDEIIVIDQSKDRYDLSDFKGVRHIHDVSIRGLTAARNRGIDETQAPRVLFIDDDVVLCEGTIAALQAAFDRYPDVIGFQCEDVEQHEVGRVFALFEMIFERGFFGKSTKRRNGLTEVSWLLGFGMAFRSRVFATERFDERLDGYSFGEDFDFSRRALRYGRLIVAPGAQVHHNWSPVNRSGVQAICRFRWANYRYFIRKHGVERSLSGRALVAWWKVGETYRWLRAGLGLPSDRKAPGPVWLD